MSNVSTSAVANAGGSPSDFEQYIKMYYARPREEGLHVLTAYQQVLLDDDAFWAWAEQHGYTKDPRMAWLLVMRNARMTK